MSSELLALASRCEVEEPSRELDAEIMFTCFAKPTGGKGYLWPEDDASWSFAIRFPGKDAEWFKKVRKGRPTLLVWRDGDPILVNDLRVKPVTSSLDAAVTLVPEGHSWKGYSHPKVHGVEDEPRCYFDVYQLAPNCETLPNGMLHRRTLNGPHEGEAKTPALALCAAALRARAAMEDVAQQ